MWLWLLPCWGSGIFREDWQNVLYPIGLLPGTPKTCGLVWLVAGVVGDYTNDQMGNVIIGIHGLGNKPRKETLENWWRLAMQEGLDRYGRPCELPHFELVYWADLLFDWPLDETVDDPDDPYYLKERYVTGGGEAEPEDHRLRRKILDFVEEQLDKLLLNPDMSINYEGLTDRLLRHYFRELEIYYSRECNDQHNIRCTARTLIRGRLVEVLQKYAGDTILLIGHSMGSIIAYDVLTFLVPELSIHTFVTIGSPLGFPVVQGKIAAEWLANGMRMEKLKTPSGIRKNWYNQTDLKDKVALVYDLRANYKPNRRWIRPRDQIVYNDYQIAGEANHHKSFGYLRTREFVDVLCRFTRKRRFLGR